MCLEKKINDHIKAAMIAKNMATLNALRTIKADLLMEKKGEHQPHPEEIPRKVEEKLLEKLAKQKKESAKMYKEQGRKDLEKEVLLQLEIIEGYLI